MSQLQAQGLLLLSSTPCGVLFYRSAGIQRVDWARFAVGDEEHVQCSAKLFVVIVHAKVSVVPISVVSDLLKSVVQSVSVLQCAPVVGCCVRSRGCHKSACATSATCVLCSAPLILSSVVRLSNTLGWILMTALSFIVGIQGSFFPFTFVCILYKLCPK